MRRLDKHGKELATTINHEIVRRPLLQHPFRGAWQIQYRAIYIASWGIISICTFRICNSCWSQGFSTTSSGMQKIAKAFRSMATAFLSQIYEK